MNLKKFLLINAHRGTRKETSCAPNQAQIMELNSETLHTRLTEAVRLYAAAMGYPASIVAQRTAIWTEHMDYPGWRCVAAMGQDDTLVGVSYGFRGAAGQWWHDQVYKGLKEIGGESLAHHWLADHFELTELHVRPEAQGKGLGEALIRRLVSTVDERHVLLSTPDTPSRAWRLYHRLQFVDLLRNYQFGNDPKPFAVLGRNLPIG